MPDYIARHLSILDNKARQEINLMIPRFLHDFMLYRTHTRTYINVRGIANHRGIIVEFRNFGINLINFTNFQICNFTSKNSTIAPRFHFIILV